MRDAATIQVEAKRNAPLANGDHLTRAEFERRFDATPHLKNAELIEGIVFIPPPPTLTYHAEPHSDLCCCLGTYAMGTPGVEGGSGSHLRLDFRNMPHADICLLIKPGHSGQVRIDSEGYIRGGPEIIGEIAASSASYDLHEKMRLYLKYQVREYLVWRTYDKAFDWFVLGKRKYNRLTPDSEGVFRSHIFPGLWLDAAALLKRDYATVTKVLKR